VETILLIAVLIVLAAAVIVLAVMLRALRNELLRSAKDNSRELQDELHRSIRDFREETANNAAVLRDETAKSATALREETAKNSTELRLEVGQKISEQSVQSEQKLENIRTTMETRLRTLQEENTKQIDGMRSTVETRIKSLQDDNTQQLDKMRATVDEKLQKTLEDRIGQSFKLVSERLEEVYKGLGEMQTLASGVGDLKKVLSNVKTRGILGEIQLGAILEEVLSKEQYEENIPTIKGSAERVEFAIKLPGGDGGSIYLPIDAKFPGDAYSNLVDAYDSGDAERIDTTRKLLITAIKLAAKNISSKYIGPPDTTDFAIMFLPFEGLYAEVIRLGLIESLQKEYKVNIAGPTTMAALLNSLQMGFRTLAIQKRSGEVWTVLGAVKKEFESFTDVLSSAQKRLEQAQTDLDKLMTTRTNAIRRKLRDVLSLSDSETEDILAIEESVNIGDAEDDPDDLSDE
jgi:DNA recombination protein RmuC